MATRPVFEAEIKSPFYKETNVDFVWNKGMNIKQKQKNIVAIHNEFNSINPQKRVLEISSKSLQKEGTKLSAFVLRKFVPSLQKSIPVENLYQGGKVFENGGPYLDLYDVPAIKAKTDDRLHLSGETVGFCYEGRVYPVKVFQSFYDWLYINALIENPELSNPLLQYDAFTDIVYNPKKGTSCQARSAAIFVSLSRMGLLNAVEDYDYFVRTVYNLT